MDIILFGFVCMVGWALLAETEAMRRRKEALKNATSYEPDRTFTSSEWADDRDLKQAGCFVDNGFLAGFTSSGKAIYFPGKRKPHGIVFGTTGSGKSTTCLMNVILTWTHALCCFDIFGELAVTCAHARSRFGRVVILAPYPVFRDALAEFPRIGFNPISPRWINPADRDLVGVRCAKIAAAIVLKEDHAAEQYWANTSRQLVTVVIICVVLYFPERSRNLATVATIIMGDVFGFACKMMEISDDPFVKAKLSRYAIKPGDKDVKSLMEVIESARTEIEFLTEPAPADCVSRDELDPDEILHGNLSIFVIQPQEVVNEMTRFRRLFATCILGRFKREDGAYATPTLFLIDELYSLGHLDELDTAFTAMRKLNLRFYLSIPSVGLLAELYPKSYKAILDNCGLKQWCDLNLDDSELVSSLCGEREIARHTKAINWSPYYNYEQPQDIDLQCLHVTHNKSTERLPLVRPHELRFCLGADGMVMFMADVPKPIYGKRRGYFDIPSLRKLARPNPFFTRTRAGKRIAAKRNDNWKNLLVR